MKFGAPMSGARGRRAACVQHCEESSAVQPEPAKRPAECVPPSVATRCGLGSSKAKWAQQVETGVCALRVVSTGGRRGGGAGHYMRSCQSRNAEAKSQSKTEKNAKRIGQLRCARALRQHECPHPQLVAHPGHMRAPAWSRGGPGTDRRVRGRRAGRHQLLSDRRVPPARPLPNGSATKAAHPPFGFPHGRPERRGRRGRGPARPDGGLPKAPAARESGPPLGGLV